MAINHRIAVVLEDLAQDLETLGTMLSGDIDIALRHIAALQAIDLIAQKQRSLAILLGAEHPEAQVELITIDILRERLRLPAE